MSLYIYFYPSFPLSHAPSLSPPPPPRPVPIPIWILVQKQSRPRGNFYTGGGKFCIKFLEIPRFYTHLPETSTPRIVIHGMHDVRGGMYTWRECSRKIEQYYTHRAKTIIILYAKMLNGVDQNAKY
jgi:hypothetical protein